MASGWDCSLHLIMAHSRSRMHRTTELEDALDHLAQGVPLVRDRWWWGATGCAEEAKRPERGALSRGPAAAGHVRRRRLESAGKVLTAAAIDTAARCGRSLNEQVFRRSEILWVKGLTARQPRATLGVQRSPRDSLHY